MHRVSFFVDGFNLYHALDDNPAFHKYKWLNLDRLSRSFIKSDDNLAEVIYFTTYCTWNQTKLAKHQIYVRALQFAKVSVVFGAFRSVDKECKICHRQYKTFEEKQTDVNIAIKLFQTAVSDSWDTAMVISGDSDLIPAVKAVKSTFPAKQVGIIIPIGRRAEELKHVADFHMKLKEKHLSSCQFDDVVEIDGNVKLTRPASWR